MQFDMEYIPHEQHQNMREDRRKNCGIMKARLEGARQAHAECCCQTWCAGGAGRVTAGATKPNLVCATGFVTGAPSTRVRRADFQCPKGLDTMTIPDDSGHGAPHLRVGAPQ
jgi:hypothetical protein